VVSISREYTEHGWKWAKFLAVARDGGQVKKSREPYRNPKIISVAEQDKRCCNGVRGKGSG
jgi:hypothetical protein